MESHHARLLAFDFVRKQVGRRVEMVGVAVSVERKPKYVRFAVDDGTGCISCILWTNQSGAPQQQAAADMARLVTLGGLLAVHGRVSRYHHHPQLTVSSLLPQPDANAE
ncbi:hypothetical protein SELMODRAFT_269089, partial [Selaginella moellendorffii]